MKELTHKEYMRAYRKKNRAHLLEQGRSYYQKNIKRLRKYNREWKRKHKKDEN